jgi:spore coat polysaccharide biosynthesis predicted glycosyltransferase SpsG
MKKKAKKLYLIRCCSNPKIGLGHFMRCLKIYNELKKRKETAIMFIDKKFDFMNNFNFKFYEIYPLNNSFNNEKKDAEKFITLVKKKI